MSKTCSRALRARCAGLSFLSIQKNRTLVLTPQELRILGHSLFPFFFENMCRIERHENRAVIRLGHGATAALPSDSKLKGWASESLMPQVLKWSRLLSHNETRANYCDGRIWHRRMLPHGLEPWTSRLLAERSSQLSYESCWCKPRRLSWG